MAAAAAPILVGSLASTAVAAPPEPVRIVSHMTVSQPDAANAGVFTSTGSDAICQAGTVLDDRLLISGWPSRAGRLQILVVKGGTGDFVNLGDWVGASSYQWRRRWTTYQRGMRIR